VVREERVRKKRMGKGAGENIVVVPFIHHRYKVQELFPKREVHYSL